MPSPFPGMDPYLEDPNQWESFHSCFINVLHEMLRDRVRPHFVVLQQTAVYLVEPGGERLLVAERTITTPTILKARYPEEIRQRYLEIRDRTSRTVVSTIEVLSPTNKDRRGGGFDQFDRKRRDVMASPVHWLEIDLLRAGERPDEGAAGRSDYYALLKRGHGSPVTPPPAVGEVVFHAWFWNVRDVLPVVAVPLRPPFPDVALDLQAALTTVYDRFYDGIIDYALPPPPPPLSPPDAAWAEEQVRAWQAGQPA